MDKVYFLQLKSEKENFYKRVFRNGNNFNEFSVWQDTIDDFYVYQCINLGDPFEIDSSRDFSDDVLRLIERSGNLPKEKDQYSLTVSENLPGNYYNRIYRPSIKETKPIHQRFGFGRHNYQMNEIPNYVFKRSVFLPYDELGLLSSLNQLSLLVSNLRSIFQTIHPENKNLNAYGHNIRNLLILACTEVETQLKGVLLCNNYKPNQTSYSTSDYSILMDIFKLDEYVVKLDYYPWLEEFSPFQGWDQLKPSQSLKWYYDYNQVKHDRENKFELGSLKNAIDAIAAIAILIYAQYGEQKFYWQVHVGGFISFVKTPEWELEEKYIPPIKGSEWESCNYFDLNKISRTKKTS